LTLAGFEKADVLLGDAEALREFARAHLALGQKRVEVAIGDPRSPPRVGASSPKC